MNIYICGCQNLLASIVSNTGSRVCGKLLSNLNYSIPVIFPQLGIKIVCRKSIKFQVIHKRIPFAFSVGLCNHCKTTSFIKMWITQQRCVCFPIVKIFSLLFLMLKRSCGILTSSEFSLQGSVPGLPVNDLRILPSFSVLHVFFGGVVVWLEYMT